MPILSLSYQAISILSVSLLALPSGGYVSAQFIRGLAQVSDKARGNAASIYHGCCYCEPTAHTSAASAGASGYSLALTMEYERSWLYAIKVLRIRHDADVTITML